MTFRELMGELSSRLGMEVEDEGGASAVEIDGLVIFMVGANDDLILLHADLGEIPPDVREDVIDAAMEANFLYQGTGGCTLAVNPHDGHLQLQKYNWLERLDGDKIINTLERFANTAAIWRKMAQDLVAKQAETESGLGADGLGMDGGGIRV